MSAGRAGARGTRPMSGGGERRRGSCAKMESVALVAPVTALEFAGDALLAGEHRYRHRAGGGTGGGGG